MTAWLKELLDPRLHRRLTPSLLPLLFAGLVLAAGAAGIGTIVAAAQHSWWLGLLALVLTPPAVLIVVVLIRVVCELILAFATLAERTGDMAADLSDVATDMPRVPLLALGRRRRIP